MNKEFNLSEKIIFQYNVNGSCVGAWFRKEDVKEFIRLTEKQNKDFSDDIIDLIEINNYGKEDLIIKMKKLIEYNKQIRNRLAGDKLK